MVCPAQRNQLLDIEFLDLIVADDMILLKKEAFFYFCFLKDSARQHGLMLLCRREILGANPFLDDVRRRQEERRHLLVSGDLRPNRQYPCLVSTT